MPTLQQKLETATQATIASAGARYSPSLDPDAPNIEIADLVDAVSALALADRARDLAREYAATLRKVAKDADHTLSRVLTGVRTTPEVVADHLERLAALEAARDVQVEVAECRRHLRVVRRTVERRRAATERDISAARDRPDDEVVGEDERRVREGLEHRARDLRAVSSSLRSVEEWVCGVDGQLLADRQCVLLLGPWGSGKTHFLCDFALAAGSTQVPAVVVLASSLRGDLEPLDALSAAIGVGRGGADLASRLDRAGKRVGRRALIIIDAINEADRVAWRRRLAPLARTVARYEHLGLVLSCRTPFDQTIVDSVARRHFVVLHHRGFESNEFDAQQEFFAHYQLPAPHVPLITPEFSRPLFLRLLCEAFARLSRSSQHRQLNDVASGQKGVTYVLEYFAKSVGARIEAVHSVPGLTCWKLMKGQPGKGHIGFAGLMAARRRDYIWASEAVDEVVSQTALSRVAAESFARSMVSEGLLAEDMRYVEDRYQAVLTFPYQRFADHLIARHLLAGHLDTTSETALRRSFYVNRPLGALFSLDDWSSQYAEPGLASAVMLEFPERVKRHGYGSELLEYLPADRRLLEPFARAFLEGLSWRDASAFTGETSRVIDRLLDFNIPWLTADVYEALLGLAARPAHPLNAESLWRRLSTQPMPKRDYTWSESLRAANATSNIRRLIAWAERPSRPAVDRTVAVNEMRLLALALTSTNRELRDRCTRALVLLGDNQPSALFALTLEALNFSDPYVGERMLAASYGVCMRRWPLAAPRSTFASAVADLAAALLDQVLRPTGQHFTWHTLTRGYAVGIVQLARRIRPRSLRSSEVAVLVPDPHSAPTPFRAASRIRPRDTEEGAHAIHMDFANYTMGRLVTGRRNYDMKHFDYRRVRRQIEDRIQRLGYSKDLFGEIDRQVGHSSWRSRDVGKTDRYGKKYSWIAYFEMYGLRAAAGLLDDRWHDRERSPDCDIDPSFPREVPFWSPPSHDVFNASPTKHRAWLEGGRVPDYRELLDRTDVDGVSGDWVLLDAVIRQHGSHGREVASNVASVLATARNVARLRAEFAGGRHFEDPGIPSSGTDHYTYLGEVPWSRHFGSSVRTPRGKPRHMRERAFDYFAQGKWKAGIPVEAATRSWAWEGYHSELNQVGSVEFPAPVLADHLALRSVGGSADLVDATGRAATLYRVSPNDGLGSHYLYMRRDLLNVYLRSRDLQLVRAVWGERTLEYEFFTGEISDELREPFVRGINTFHFAECNGAWLSLN